VTAVIERPAAHAPEPPPPSLREQLWARRVELGTLAVLLLIAAITHATNLHHWPQYFEDESTYVSQAWAVQTRGQLSHYTYWYDHPPLAWIQIAIWTFLTGGWARLGSGIQVGREVALLANLVSVGLLFTLARRMGMHLAISVVVVLLFVLSPLSVYFQRMALLDNLLMTWVLAAFVLAYSPRQRLFAYASSGVCLAIACQMKITSGVYLPILLWLIWRNAQPPTRRYGLTLFGTSFAFAGSFWFLMALLKGELFPDTAEWFPGDERVSLLGTQRWVLFIRGASSGWILDPESGGYYLLNQSLLSQDRWLLGAGLVCSVLVLASRRYRWVGVTFLLLCAAILRSSTLSWPFFAQFLPFAALAVGGLLDSLRRVLVRPRMTPSWAAATAAIGLVVLGATQFAPAWAERIRHAHTHDANGVYEEAATWLMANADPTDRLLVDNTMWIQLVLAGHDPDNVVWFWKLEYDPEVIEKHADWRSFDYVVSSPFVRDTVGAGMVPQMASALENSAPVAEFVQEGFERESVWVSRIVPPGVGDGAPAADALIDVDANEGRSAGSPPGLEAGAPGARRGLTVPEATPVRPDEAPAEPPEVIYVVRPGDSVSEIAVRFGVTVAEIVAANDLENPDYIRIDQELEIPAPATEG
jgi:LysM repeat protein